MSKDEKYDQINNESFSLFIDKVSLIIMDRFLEGYDELDNKGEFKTAQ